MYNYVYVDIYLVYNKFWVFYYKFGFYYLEWEKERANNCLRDWKGK